MDIITILLACFFLGLLFFLFTYKPEDNNDYVPFFDKPKFEPMVSVVEEPAEPVEEEVKPKTRVKKPTLPSEEELNKMTKVQLLELAQEKFGLTLNKRLTKSDIIVELLAAKPKRKR